MLANGSSLRVAARYVGCASTTITRTAARDPQFAADLARAEQNAEIEALRLLRRAARKERYWRAAAWLLERKNPDDFAPRQPTLFTKEQLAQVSLSIMLYLTDDMPDEKFEEVLNRLDELIREQSEKPKKEEPRTIPRPTLDDSSVGYASA